jgi:hypothetical protein
VCVCNVSLSLSVNSAMPHPSVLSGYEELLELSESILFNVPLPNGVLDKYKMIQTQVKERMYTYTYTLYVRD